MGVVATELSVLAQNVQSKSFVLASEECVVKREGVSLDFQYCSFPQLLYRASADEGVVATHTVT